ncbi:YncE family protein [Billgrantia ethanolica]|uniref:Beta-propeller fold lactonase family protein n=1 Tax=Billgrantia ethanolica TaxID=2733486 RepID=A0ABS9A1R8_9GAMM|nr:cytochrome D1 domain-containing protein [Halomonas ethanolica]MCE8002774.1 beta-propeller fold lactonase family protein [Halomonas ethanolica]
MTLFRKGTLAPRPVTAAISHTHLATRFHPAFGWLLAVGLTLASTVSLAGQMPHGQVFTANEHGASLTHIQLDEGTTTTHDIAIAPHNVQVSADGRYLMAVGERAGHAHGGDGHTHAHGDEPGKLKVFDALDFDGTPLAVIPVGSHPAHVVSDQSGQFAFVTNAGDASVSVIDLTAREVVATIATGEYPHGLRLSPDGSELYVANVMDGSVSVIDVAAREEVARIPVGATPVQVGFTADGAQLYVSLRDENRVAVIDTTTREVTATVEVNRLPIQVYGTPDSRLMLVANEGTSEEPDNRVSVIDTRTQQVVATHEVGAGAHGISIDANGRFAFVTSLFDDSLAIIDLTSGDIVATHATGQGPNGVTWLAN